MEWNTFEKLPVGDIIVCGRMRYEWEKEWEYFSGEAECDVITSIDERQRKIGWEYGVESIYWVDNKRGYRIVTYDDWYEGQHEFEFLGWIAIPEVDKNLPPLKIITLEMLDEVVKE